MNNLHPIAQAVQSQGRGKDTQLIHMTPNEVQGLQALAMANGGSLSINPSTGLPEAGFLDKILPAVAGFALGPAGFGVMSSLGAGLTVGGLTALTSGDLGKGISAGLGAWGGSELGGALQGLGSSAIGGQAASNATTLATQQGKAGIGAAANAAREAAVQEATKSELIKEGARQALSDPSKAVEAFGGLSGAAKVAGAVGAPMLADQLSQQTATKMPEKRTPTTVAELEYQRKVRSLKDRDPNDTSEFNYFEGPGYVKTGETTYAAKGGIMGYARGGSPVSGGKRAIVSNEDYLNQYFSPVQTATQMPDTKKKADGGIISLAEGGSYGPYGEGYTPMTPEEFARMYMTPQAAPGPMRGGVSGYEGVTRNTYTPSSTPGTGGQTDILTDAEGRKYRLEFDPATGTYRKIYEDAGPAPTPEAPKELNPYDNLGGDSGSDVPNPGGNYWAAKEKGLIDLGFSKEKAQEMVRNLQVEDRANLPKTIINALTPLPIKLAQMVLANNTDQSPAPVEGRGEARGPNAFDPGGGFSTGPAVTGVTVGGPMAPNAVPEGVAINPGVGYAPSVDPGVQAAVQAQEAAVQAQEAAARDAYNSRFSPTDSGSSGGGGGHDAGITGGNSFSAPDGGGYNEAAGGLISLAAGGMAQGGFVVPADVVSALGNGSTAAGLRALKVKLGDVKHIKGKGDGLSDSIPTSIDGIQPARVADGEAYIAPKTVAAVGGGDMKKGAKKLYAMLDNVRKAAHGKTTQQRKVNPAKALKV